MNIQRSVLREVRMVAVGVLICDVLMCAVFAALHALDWKVVLGALLGSVLAVGNIWLLAAKVQKIADADEETKKQAQKLLKTSYTVRTMGMVLGITLGLILQFNYIALLVPLLLPKPIMLLRQAILKRREQQGKGET